MTQAMMLAAFMPDRRPQGLACGTAHIRSGHVATASHAITYNKPAARLQPALAEHLVSPLLPW